MYVLDVIPFSRSAPAGTLTYRSRAESLPGTLVTVTLRRKVIQAMVVSCMTVAEAKYALKSASFSLSGSVPAERGRIPDALLAAAERTATYHAAPLGVTLAALFGEFIRADLPFSFDTSFMEGEGFAEIPCEALLADRRTEYRAMIHQQLEVKRSTLLVVPTTAEVTYWSEAFADLSPVVIAGSLAPKLRSAAFAAAYAGPALIICTPSFSWLPLPLLGRIVVERVSAGSYRLMQRPYLDMRRALAELARARQLPVVYGDLPLPLEYRLDPAAALTVRTEAPVQLIDARITEEQKLEGATWQAVGEEAKNVIRNALAADGRVLVLAVRKGYAPTVICRDCGQTLTDNRGAVFSFTTRNGKRLLRTADGVTERSADLLCPHCASWNLMPLGIGIERVAEELRAAFPEVPVIEVVSEVRTKTGARKVLQDAAVPGTIVVGTEAMLPWLLALGIAPFDLGILASADSLLSVPFWRARERLVRLGLLLAQCVRSLSVVSRLPEDAAIQTLVDSGTGTFFAEETALREAVQYPPFGTLVSLQVEASRARIEETVRQVLALLGEYAVTALPDRTLTTTLVRRSLVLQLPKDAWPDAALSERLQHLPLSVRVLVDPEAF